MNILKMTAMVLGATFSGIVPVFSDVLVIRNGVFERYDKGNELIVFGTLPIEKDIPKYKNAPIRTPKYHPPRAEILRAIIKTSQRYAKDRAIARAGMTARQWGALLQANIQIESAYNPKARSHVGAIGLGQLMPATAKDLGVNPHDMHENLDGAARYLLMMLREFGSKELALAAYNAGPDAVNKYGGIPPFKETQGHVRKVLGVYNQILKN